MVYKIFTKMITDSQDVVKNGLLNSYSVDNLPLFYENHLEVLNFLAECYFLNERFEAEDEDIEKIS